MDELKTFTIVICTEDDCIVQQHDAIDICAAWVYVNDLIEGKNAYIKSIYIVEGQQLV